MFEHGTKGNWKKYEKNPLIGGSYGSCFDIAVLDEGEEIYMYFSWRKEKRMRELETELKDVLVEMTAVKGAEEALKRMKDKGI